MTVDEALVKWKAQKRSMDAAAAAAWFCHQVPGFQPVRVRRYTPTGEEILHVVASDGVRRIDLVPYAPDGAPREDRLLAA